MGAAESKNGTIQPRWYEKAICKKCNTRLSEKEEWNGVSFYCRPCLKAAGKPLPYDDYRRGSGA